jgi:hypothetical protein
LRAISSVDAGRLPHIPWAGQPVVITGGQG